MSEESDALLHIADDHPCCKLTLLWVHNRLLELERESAALKQRIIDDNKAYGCEIRDPSGTIWDHAQKLQNENAELREAVAITDDYINQMLHGDIELPHGILQSWRNMNNAARKEAQP